MQAQLHAKDTVISKLKEIIHSLRDNANPDKVKKDIDEIETINIELEHSVAKLLSKNEKLNKDKEHLKKTYKELYDLIKLTRVRAKEQCEALIDNLNFSKPNATTIALGMYKLDLEPLAPKLLKNKDAHIDYIKHFRDRVICSTGASGSKPTDNTKNNMISQSSSSNKTNKVEDQSRSVKSRKNKKNRVVQILLWYLDSGCSKHMTENRSQLTNFVKKLIGTVKFGNDQIAKIMGYSDYQTGNDIEVSFCKHTSFVRNLEGVDLLMGSRGTNLYTMSIGDMMKSSPICLLSKTSKTNYYEDVGISHETSVVSTPQQNDVVERRNRILVEVVYTMLIYAKAPLFLWAEAVAIACYTQNHSLIRLRHGKTPHELLHDRKPDLSSLYVFGALCYPTNDSEDLGKLKAKDDVGLTPQPPSSTPFIPPTRDDWDTLLQPLFDEYFRPPPCVDHPVPEVAAPVSAVSTGSPSSTLVDQDPPSPSTSQTPKASPSHVIAPGAEEADHDIEVAYMDNNPQFGIPIS
ncbi:retrovirus-related pol polyprotein from transposon TNT 1-94 [Tanacetum coccineum]